MRHSLDDIKRELRKYPDGVTTRELADQLGMAIGTLSSRLSKAFIWGRGIEREHKHRDRLGGRECIWRVS